MKTEIEKTLQPLLGRPLWAIGRAGSLEWFQFGAEHTAPARNQATKQVGEYALHVDCRWTLTSPAGQVVATDTSNAAELSSAAALRLVGGALLADENGNVSLTFVGGHCLAIRPDDSEVEEYWRFLEPGHDRPHFVVGPSGVERPE